MTIILKILVWEKRLGVDLGSCKLYNQQRMSIQMSTEILKISKKKTSNPIENWEKNTNKQFIRGYSAEQ